MPSFLVESLQTMTESGPHFADIQDLCREGVQVIFDSRLDCSFPPELNPDQCTLLFSNCDASDFEGDLSPSSKILGFGMTPRAAMREAALTALRLAGYDDVDGDDY